MYRDCNPSSNGQDPANINFSVFRTDGGSFVQNYSAPKVNEYTLSKQQFSNCINPRPDICYIIFEYAISMDLETIPGGYTLATQRCCRIDGIQNMQAPSNTEGVTYTITIPGSNSGTNASYNSSPIFAEKDTALTCYNSRIELDYSARDPDGDVLVYSFAPALSGGSSGTPSPTTASPPPYPSVPYSLTYTADDPFGTNLYIDPNTGIITGNTPGSNGEYVLAVTIKEYRNGRYIAETRKELHVVVTGCSLAAADLPSRISACDSFAVKFENGSLSPAIRSYNWDFGVPGIDSDTSSLPSPTYVYPDTGRYIIKLTVNRSEECADSAFSSVAVYPGFKPGYTVFGSCLVNPFRFTDTTKSRYGTVQDWKWDFGEPGLNNDTSVLRNPSYRYPTLGLKEISFSVEDDKGCFQTIKRSLNVLEKPPLQLAFKDTLICSIDTLQLRAGSSGTYVWTPDFRIINRFSATPFVYPVDTTVYYVTVTDGGCTNTDSVKINVLDFITVNAGNDTTICRTDSVQLRAVSHGLQYAWTPTATITNPTLKNIFARPVNPLTTYTATAFLGKCSAQDEVTVRTIPYPTANAGVDTTICFNTNATLNGNIIASSFTWTPRNGLSNPTSLHPTVRLSSTTAFVLTVLDVLGCPKPSRDTVFVNVLPKLNVFAGNDTSVILGQPLQWQLADISAITTWQWSPATGMNNPNIHNPVVNLTTEDLFSGQESILYALKGTTAIGCTETDQVLVRIFKTGPSIFVPSGFTPNADGKNDVLKPILAGMKSLDYFRVYNRLGQIVFQTSTQNKGWDGRINGELQPAAAYVYAAQATDYLGKVVTQSGTFILIR